ncbi:uncharacterized protein LOC124795607, partial [Schistocerca piceifrons]|uniref:uncharacterized protein LOC124795607 n=1 Tax=Schistocerca piceifrons TaxID=274613 RepID=UPI001F5FD6F4
KDTLKVKAATKLDTARFWLCMEDKLGLDLNNKDCIYDIINVLIDEVKELKSKSDELPRQKLQNDGNVIPGAPLTSILESCNNLQNLTMNDTVIIWGGTNDVARNEADKALNAITSALIKLQHTNVIIVRIPHRYDLENWSCVNDETRRTNRKIAKIVKSFQNTQFVTVPENRGWYTSHGLHLNANGKEEMARTLLAVISPKNQLKPAISLEWKDPDGTEQIMPQQEKITVAEINHNVVKRTVTNNGVGRSVCSNRIFKSPETHCAPRRSSRPIKPRVQSDMFLWESKATNKFPGLGKNNLPSQLVKTTEAVASTADSSASLTQSNVVEYTTPVTATPGSSATSQTVRSKKAPQQLQLTTRQTEARFGSRSRNARSPKNRNTFNAWIQNLCK